jgi:L-rhamnose mutarotase
MERIAFHIEIREGKRENYREAHEDVDDALERAYLESEAAIETYSVFEGAGHVFGYLEVEDPQALREVMAESDAQDVWDEKMEPILAGEAEWLEEVYRLR